MSLNIRPLHDRVLIKREEEATESAGGIIIPDSATEKPMRGTIVATGKGRVTDTGEVRALDVKTGDHVYFAKYSGTELKIQGEEMLMMREEDIMAVEE